MYISKEEIQKVLKEDITFTTLDEYHQDLEPEINDYYPGDSLVALNQDNNVVKVYLKTKDRYFVELRLYNEDTGLLGEGGYLGYDTFYYRWVKKKKAEYRYIRGKDQPGKKRKVDIETWTKVNVEELGSMASSYRKRINITRRHFKDIQKRYPQTIFTVFKKDEIGNEIYSEAHKYGVGDFIAYVDDYVYKLMLRRKEEAFDEVVFFDDKRHRYGADATFCFHDRSGYWLDDFQYITYNDGSKEIKKKESIDDEVYSYFYWARMLYLDKIAPVPLDMIQNRFHFANLILLPIEEFDKITYHKGGKDYASGDIIIGIDKNKNVLSMYFSNEGPLFDKLYFYNSKSGRIAEKGGFSYGQEWGYWSEEREQSYAHGFEEGAGQNIGISWQDWIEWKIKDLCEIAKENSKRRTE